MSKKSELLAIAAAAITLTSLTQEMSAIAAPKKAEKSVECFGINTCKGTNGCGMGQQQIDLANKTYANRFATSKPMDCAGNSDCSAKKGFLAWVKKDTKEDCLTAKGFVFEKDAQGNLTLVDKKA